ncbi:MAG TPA: GIY-YIG nuclease family protein [Feifaniaceae bacterium]|nr:GIY-YIG nuclease family protein [Feifaniaceae bacterium]
MDRRKELKQQYKLNKPQMGVFVIRCLKHKRCHLQATPDLRGVMNGAKARLNANSHPHRALQQDYNHLGAEQFAMEILETLPYDKDETKTDYSEELALLQMIWEEKLLREGYAFYGKREE